MTLIISRCHLITHLCAVISLGLVVLLAGCASEPPFTAKSPVPPQPVYCFDGVGHLSGAKPFILGGTCCCTPTEELMAKYHADGLLQDMQFKNLLALL